MHLWEQQLYFIGAENGTVLHFPVNIHDMQ